MLFECFLDLKNASALNNKKGIREVKIDYNNFSDGKVKVSFACLNLPSELSFAIQVGEINLVKE